MIQKKREQFKRQIRRKQLDSIFRERRIELLQPLNFQSYASSMHSSQLASYITHSIESIETNLKYQNYGEIQRIFNSLYKQVKENAFEVSAYLMIQAAPIGNMLKHIIENQQSIDEGETERKKLTTSVQLQLLNQFLELLFLMNYRQLREDYFLKLISSLWLIFSNQDINIYSEEHHFVLDLLLKVLKKMLSSKSRIVLSSLKSIGLGQQLTRIIQYDNEFLSSENELTLIQIIESYVTLESAFKDNSYVHEVNGAAILEMQTSQKRILMTFSLYLINKKHEEAYYFALNSLISIFERHEYLISSLDIKYARQISELIKNPIKKVQMKALELTDDIIYRDKEKGDQYLRGCYLPDVLYTFLRQQLKDPSEFTRAYCSIAGNIICNLTLCKKREESKLDKHPIWDLAYQNIHMSSPLLPLVTIFQFYFQTLPRKVAITLLENYLCSVGLLDMNLLQKREFQAIKRTIQREYCRCLDFWPEEYEHKFRAFIWQNKLQPMLEDLMDIQDQKQPISI